MSLGTFYNRNDLVENDYFKKMRLSFEVENTFNTYVLITDFLNLYCEQQEKLCYFLFSD